MGASTNMCSTYVSDLLPPIPEIPRKKGRPMGGPWEFLERTTGLEPAT